MPATLRQVRVKLPRPLFEQLSIQAGVENTDVGALILRAVQADLRGGRARLLPPLRRGFGRRKKST